MNIQVKASPAALKRVRMFAMLAAVILLFIMIGDLIRTQHYVNVKAQITQTSSRSGQRTHSSQKQGIIHEVACAYPAGSTVYSAKFRTFFPFMWKEGTWCDLRYDPNLPERIRSPFLYEAGVMMLGFALLFAGFTTLCLHTLKKQAQTWQTEPVPFIRDPWQ